MAGKLRVDIVGLGRIFDLPCLGYRENPLVEGIGLCDAREDLLRQRAAAFPAAHGVQPFEALLRFDCHLVEILTPHPLHAELPCSALRTGSHVSVQKPMARTWPRRTG